MSVTLNGKPQRKQLGDQLDRLDGIIDVLADAIPGAVADATREGARQAVREVVAELLASPELRTLIAELSRRDTPAPAPDPTPTPRKPSAWSRIKEKFAATKEVASRRCRAARSAATVAVKALSSVMPLGRVLAVGGAVGLAVGAVGYACPPAVSAAAAGAGAAFAAVAAQAGRWLWRSAAMLGVAGGN